MGSFILSSFTFIPDIRIAIGVVFVASCFISLALPSINAAYADYISDAPRVEGEIEGLEDSAFNIGYVLGPILAGVLSDIFSINTAFSILGLLGAILAFIVLFLMPKRIVVCVKQQDLQG
jgi:predicted MFS family arabinose efflux permease